MQFEYLNEMEYALKAASVCVSRAGSNTLFELMSLKIPSVLIPLPAGTSRGDQIDNADYFYKKGLAEVLPQKVLTEESLISAINAVYLNRFNILRNFDSTPINDASRQISRIIADLGGNVISVHHERANEGSDVTGCYLRIMLETRNYDHIYEIKKALTDFGFKLL